MVIHENQEVLLQAVVDELKMFRYTLISEIRSVGKNIIDSLSLNSCNCKCNNGFCTPNSNQAENHESSNIINSDLVPSVTTTLSTECCNSVKSTSTIVKMEKIAEASLSYSSAGVNLKANNNVNSIMHDEKPCFVTISQDNFEIKHDPAIFDSIEKKPKIPRLNDTSIEMMNKLVPYVVEIACEDTISESNSNKKMEDCVSAFSDEISLHVSNELPKKFDIETDNKTNSNLSELITLQTSATASLNSEIKCSLKPDRVNKNLRRKQKLSKIHSIVNCTNVDNISSRLRSSKCRYRLTKSCSHDKLKKTKFSKAKDSPPMYRCEICKSVFSSSITKRKMYLCTKCGALFGKKKQLKKHKVENHVLPLRHLQKDIRK